MAMMKRKPPKGNSRRVQYIDGNIRFTITNKAGDSVQCESFQERKLTLLMHRDHKVVNYMSQPDPIHYITSTGIHHSYPPDFRVNFITGPDAIWEVALSQRRKEKPSIQEREYMANILFPSMGLTYHVFTEEVLPNDTETANLMVFYASRFDRCANPVVQDAALHVLSNRPLHIEQLISQVMAQSHLERGIVHITLRYLIWHGVLEIDWKKLFYPTTPLTGKMPSKTAMVWVPGA
jgi:hypothetical protein